jgi:hypothetical protein
VILTNGETVNISIAFQAPLPTGIKGFHQPAKSVSKGNATDRATTRILLESSELNALQQRLEMEDVEQGVQSLQEINPLVRKAAGLHVHDGDLQEKENIVQGKKRFITTPNKCKEKTKDELEGRTPQIKLNDMVPREVHRRTGFRDLGSLLSYAAVLCGGDLVQLTRTDSVMTWLEEWVFFFEMMYGRATIRIGDYAKAYKISVKPLRKVFRNKLKLGVECRKRWPMYATNAEDIAFRKEKWNVHFDPIKGH